MISYTMGEIVLIFVTIFTQEQYKNKNGNDSKCCSGPVFLRGKNEIHISAVG